MARFKSFGAIDVFYIVMIVAGAFLIVDHKGGGIFTQIIHFVGGAKIGIYGLALLSKHRSNNNFRRYSLIAAAIIQVASFVCTVIISLIVYGVTLYGILTDIEMFIIIEIVIAMRYRHVMNNIKIAKDLAERGVVVDE
jgi:diacylglycerol kinase